MFHWCPLITNYLHRKAGFFFGRRFIDLVALDAVNIDGDTWQESRRRKARCAGEFSHGRVGGCWEKSSSSYRFFSSNNFHEDFEWTVFSMVFFLMFWHVDWWLMIFFMSAHGWSHAILIGKFLRNPRDPRTGTSTASSQCLAREYAPRVSLRRCRQIAWI